MKKLTIEVSEEVNVLDYYSERELAQALSDFELGREFQRRGLQYPSTQEILNALELTRDFLCDKVGLQHTCSDEQLMRELERIVYSPF